MRQDEEQVCEPRMGAAMAIAIASRSGLLQAMAKDDCRIGRTADEWADLLRASKPSTKEIIRSLVGAHVVVVEEKGNGAPHYKIPSGHAAEIREMGGIFEALLIHPRDKMDADATMNLIRFRCEKVLAGGSRAF